MAGTTFDHIDLNGDGVVTRAEFSAFTQGQLTPPATQAVEVQPLSSMRIHRAEGSVVTPSVILPARPVQALVAGQPSTTIAAPRTMMASLPPSAGVLTTAQPLSAASLQPRVVPFEQASATLTMVEAQTRPMPMSQPTFLESQLVDLKRSAQLATTGTVHELKAQTEAERNIVIRSMQETTTLQIRMLEELLEQKVNKALESISMVAGQCEDRFAHVEAHSLEVKVATEELRRDLDALHSHVAQAGPGHDASNLHHDIESMQSQHRVALSAIQAQKEQHHQLQSLHDELRQRLESGGAAGLQMPQSQGDLHMQHSELSDLRHEINQVTLQQRQQGEQLQELEAQVVQHLQGMKEQQQNDALLLRQDLEATLAANSHGEGLMELHQKYEDVSRAVEVALRDLPPERQAAPSLDRLEMLETERQERARELNSLASFLQEEREERIRIDEELDARQHQASEETFRSVNQAFDDFRGEMRALADQMLRQVPERSEIESMVAKCSRPERDARAEFTRFLEAERGGRVQDLENEREARTRETADLRAAIQRVAEQVLARAEDGELSARVQALEREHASHVSSVTRDIDDLRGSMGSTEVTRTGQWPAVHDALPDARTSRSPGGDPSLRPDLEALSKALEQETAQRCESCAELHSRMTRESAEGANLMERLSQEILERSQAERLRELSACRAELGQSVERERQDRVAQCEGLRTDLTKAIAVERDERIAENSDQRAEIAKMAQTWHKGMKREIAILRGEEVPEEEPERAEQEQPGLFSRLFRKSRASATE